MADLAELQDRRYAPPTADVADTPYLDAEHALAGRGRRLAAVLLDVVVFYAVMFVAVLPIGVGKPTAGVGTISMGFLLLVFVGLMAVNIWLLVQRGQTLGKMALGVRIVNRDGAPASAWQLVGKRYILNTLFTMIPFFGGVYALVDICMIFRASRYCLHDDIAGTMVVRA